MNIDLPRALFRCPVLPMTSTEKPSSDSYRLGLDEQNKCILHQGTIKLVPSSRTQERVSSPSISPTVESEVQSLPDYAFQSLLHFRRRLFSLFQKLFRIETGQINAESKFMFGPKTINARRNFINIDFPMWDRIYFLIHRDSRTETLYNTPEVLLPLSCWCYMRRAPAMFWR